MALFFRLSDHAVPEGAAMWELDQRPVPSTATVHFVHRLADHCANSALGGRAVPTAHLATGADPTPLQQKISQF